MGATVAAVARPGAKLRALMAFASESPGTLLVPVLHPAKRRGLRPRNKHEAGRAGGKGSDDDDEDDDEEDEDGEGEDGARGLFGCLSCSAALSGPAPGLDVLLHTPEV